MTSVELIADLYVQAARAFGARAKKNARETLLVLADALEELDYRDAADQARDLVAEIEAGFTRDPYWGWSALERGVLRAIGDLDVQLGDDLRGRQRETLLVLADALEEVDYQDVASHVREVATNDIPEWNPRYPWGWKTVEARLLRTISELRERRPPADTIRNPNSCGQGYSPGHGEHPFHGTLIDSGLFYSHSTPVFYGDQPVVHHAYAREVGGQRVRHVSVWRTGDPIRPFIWESSTPGSGRSTKGFDARTLAAHLARAERYRIQQAAGRDRRRRRSWR